MLRALFISLSQNPHLRALSEQSALGQKLSGRFVAGMTVEAALSAATEMNAEGLAVSLDSLGESVTDAEHAFHSASVYHQILDQR